MDQEHLVVYSKPIYYNHTIITLFGQALKILLCAATNVNEIYFDFEPLGEELIRS